MLQSVHEVDRAGRQRSLSPSSFEASSGTVGEVIRFGPFALHPTRRVLTKGDTRVRLGSRAFDILLLLVNRAGAFVSKDEFFRHVWRDIVVVENNLPVHVNALRKALGDGRGDRRYIVTAPHRGYSFVEPVARSRPDVA